MKRGGSMDKHSAVCGCGGKTRPLDELRSLIAELERREAIRKAREKQEMLISLCRHVLGTQPQGNPR
jgi:hypothetical protein